MDFKRREILHKISTATVGMSILTNTSTASVTDNNGDSWEVEEAVEKDRRNAIDFFKSDPDVETLLQYARNQGWSYNIDEARSTKTTEPNMEKYSVVMPLQDDSNGGDENIFISWESSNDLDTTLYQYTRISEDSITQILYNVDDDGSVTSNQKNVSNTLIDVYSVKDIHSSEDDKQITTQDNMQPPGGGGSGDDCYKVCPKKVCDSYRLECIAQLVFSGIIAVGSCMGCPTIDITKSSCLVCLGSLGLTSTSPFTCKIGVNCREEYECVTYAHYVRATSEVGRAKCY